MSGDLHIIESANEYGVAREIKVEDDAVITKQTYDAAPFLKEAEERRTATAGDRWGDGHHIGFIPMAELTKIYETHQGSEERKHAILCWLRDRPKFVTFEKFLK